MDTQPSVASYFNTRKKTTLEDIKATRSSKLQLDSELTTTVVNAVQLKGLANVKKAIFCDDIQEAKEVTAKIVTVKNVETKAKTRRATKVASAKKIKENKNQPDIQELFKKMNKTDSTKDTMEVDPEQNLKTPPSTPTKRVNIMDTIKVSGNEPTFNEIKQKLTRSSRLAELKASMARFKEGQAKLEKKQELKTPASPSLNKFRKLELEVTLSPKKFQSPEKAYLSPKKDVTARKNLLNLLTPTKNALSIPASPSKQLFTSPQKAALTLPYKYRTLAELFRSIDTVCQIMHNRKEIITFKKLKPAVEELIKRNIRESHLGQIKTIYPDAYKFKQEKLRAYGSGLNQEQWELVIEPVIDQESMTSQVLLDRRRHLYNTLINKTKVLHNEFLLTLDPPMHIPLESLKKWHPEFDIERVPDLENAEIPQPPDEEKFSSGKDVLEKAKAMFNCNTRMEQALERLKKAQELQPKLPEKTPEVSSVLKGVPKALLEKVRQRQAAKALESMTRSESKEKEIQLYSRLPEFARLTRNIFVAEKKNVLPIDTVLNKLTNSIRNFMTKADIEEHLRTLSKEMPTWMVFHAIRNGTFIKISKDADISIVINKLDALLKQKTDG